MSTSDSSMFVLVVSALMTAEAPPARVTKALTVPMELQVLMMVWSNALQCPWGRWMSGCMAFEALSVARGISPLHWRRFR